MIPELAMYDGLRPLVTSMLRRTIPDQRFRLKDGRWLGYLDYGDPNGAPIMCFHGIPGSRLGYIFDTTLIKRLHIRIIAPDRPGIGVSDFQPQRTILDWPNDVVELADHLELSRFAIMGVSGGGAYAAACAYSIPERLTVVGLVSSAAPDNAPGIEIGRVNTIGHLTQRLLPWP